MHNNRAGDRDESAAQISASQLVQDSVPRFAAREGNWLKGACMLTADLGPAPVPLGMRNPWPADCVTMKPGPDRIQSAIVEAKAVCAGL